jgi:ArsR family transcriptional regulator, arsenate/arsenite/antimonite-responsive transcriptional repressor
MGISKTEEFSLKQNQISHLAKALGHPARIAILEVLMKKEDCICGDIVDELPLAQPTVSQHLKELKNAGLIKGSIEGNTVCYCVDQKGVRKLIDYLEAIDAKLEKTKTKKCC